MSTIVCKYCGMPAHDDGKLVDAERKAQSCSCCGWPVGGLNATPKQAHSGESLALMIDDLADIDAGWTDEADVTEAEPGPTIPATSAFPHAGGGVVNGDVPDTDHADIRHDDTGDDEDDDICEVVLDPEPVDPFEVTDPSQPSSKANAASPVSVPPSLPSIFPQPRGVPVPGSPAARSHTVIPAEPPMARSGWLHGARSRSSENRPPAFPSVASSLSDAARGDIVAGDGGTGLSSAAPGEVGTWQNKVAAGGGQNARDTLAGPFTTSDASAATPLPSSSANSMSDGVVPGRPEENRVHGTNVLAPEPFTGMRAPATDSARVPADAMASPLQSPEGRASALQAVQDPVRDDSLAPFASTTGNISIGEEGNRKRNRSQSHRNRGTSWAALGLGLAVPLGAIAYLEIDWDTDGATPPAMVAEIPDRASDTISAHSEQVGSVEGVERPGVVGTADLQPPQAIGVGGEARAEPTAVNGPNAAAPASESNVALLRQDARAGAADDLARPATAGAAQEPGPFDPASAMQALTDVVRRADGCLASTTRSGSLGFAITFQPSGRVASAAVSASSLRTNPIAECIRSMIGAMQIPPFTGEIVTLRLSLPIGTQAPR